MSKTHIISNEQWKKIDLDQFRESIPELKTAEHSSIHAIFSGEDTPLMASLKESNPHGFNDRIAKFKEDTLLAFKELEKPTSKRRF
jgi:hypothetical protein